MTQYITAQQLHTIFLKAEESITSRRAILDNLNVYPVPDGDTGANMSLTMKEVVKALAELSEFDTQKLTEVIAESSLMGARGNSGVILSQFIGGFCEAIEEEELSLNALKKAFDAGTHEAFSSVSNPVEGTILTVMRSTSEAFGKGSDFSKIMNTLLEQSIVTLKKTPEMLPTLEDAGVVDAGGAGFVCFVEGFVTALDSSYKGDALDFLKDLSESFSISKIKLDETKKEIEDHKEQIEAWHHKPDERYCTEGILTGVKESVPSLKKELKKMGTSLIVAKKGKYTKVHFHVKDKDEAKSYFESIGTIKKFKADDLHSQHSEFLHSKKRKSGTEIIAVINGEGFKKLYESIPVVTTIFGGETMNPSIAQFEMAIGNRSREDVILVPNNKNIFMAAEKAMSRAQGSVNVLKTTDQAQGLHTLLNFNAEESLGDNFSALESSLSLIKTFSIAKASKEVKTKNVNVKVGDFVATNASGIITKGSTIESTIESTIALQSSVPELITLYKGKDLAQEELEKISESLRKKFNCEVQHYNGDQPHYPLIIVLE